MIQLYHKGQVMDTIMGCVSSNVLAACIKKVLEDVYGPNKIPTNGDDGTVMMMMIHCNDRIN